MSVRLNKLLAQRGIGARRKCDALIQSGAVRVNGAVVLEPGTAVEPERDRVEVRGRPLPPQEAHAYYALHKPVGVISTLSDPEGRRTLRDFHPPGPRLFPVGRLDADTSGLLILTNDGELAHRLMHPRYGVSKLYRVHVDRAPSPEMLRRLSEGIQFEPGVFSSPARVRVREETAGESVIELELHEGRYRQVRRMCEAAGLRVLRLHRWGYGPLRLAGLERGLWRELSEEEVRRLRVASARPHARPPAAGGARRPASSGSLPPARRGRWMPAAAGNEPGARDRGRREAENGPRAEGRPDERTRAMGSGRAMSPGRAMGPGRTRSPERSWLTRTDAGGGRSGRRGHAGARPLDAAGRRANAGGPRANAGGPRANAGGRRTNAGGPRANAGGRRVNAGGPRANASGRRSGAGGWRFDARSRRSGTGGRRPDAGGRRSDAGGRRPDARGRRSDAGGWRSDGARRVDAGGRRSDARSRRVDAGGRRSDARGRRPDARGPRGDAGGRRGARPRGRTPR
ncbi:MAG TPA: pseudouridine synthase [Candidatus Eisenbacteria bacterium]